ncbi:MAG: DUF6516 family protein [Nitrospirota bacterium]
MSQVQDYFNELNLKLMESEIIEGFQIKKERITITDGYIRIQGKLINGDLIEFSEYCRFYNEMVVEEYTFHWQDSKGNLIRRWDNAKHHPELKNFPHHVHVDEETKVLPSECNPQQTLLLLEKLEQLYGEKEGV